MTGLIHRWRRPMRPAEPDEARPPGPGPTSGCDAADASVVSVRTERLRWRCARDYLWLINGPDAPDWMNLSAEPAAELVKRSGPRQVWRLRLGRHELFAKIYRPVTFTDHLRRLLRGSASGNERRVARYALQAGLHAPLPVACGQTNHRWLGRDDILITQAVSSALPLNVRWLQICQLADRWQRYRQGRLLGEALAYSLARAHQSGLQHPDLHAANLLVEPAEEGPPRIVFVDLQAARTGRPVGDRAVIKNLVQLNQWFQRHASRTDRLRFLKQYLLYRQRFASLEHARQLGIAYPAIVARIQRRARRHAARLWAKRDRTAVRDGRYFARISLPGGWRGHVFLQAKKPLPGSRASGLVFTRAQWQRWLANPLQWVDPGCQQLVKGSHTATVCRAYLPVDHEPLEVICKRATPRTWLKRLYWPFRPSRTLQSWRRGYALLNRDLPTARPLAALERRRAGLLLDSLCITEAIRDGHDLDAMLRLHLVSQPGPRQRRVKNRLIVQLVRLIRDLHDRGFLCRDLKAPNVMVQWNSQSADPPAVYLVDLDGIARPWRVSRRAELAALVRLNVSLDTCSVVTRTDRLRFLEAYTRAPGGSCSDLKALWRELQVRSEKKRRTRDRRLRWKLRSYAQP